MRVATARLPIPRHLLIAGEPFGARLPAPTVLAAIARGIQAARSPAPDPCPLPGVAEPYDDPRALLDELGFETRMRSAKAVILAVAELHERTLAGSLAFEIATRARQAGVPAYAITANSSLDRFDARVLDLQVILQARGAATLTRAAERLAALA